MVKSLFLSLGDLRDSRILMLLLKVVGVTLALFGVLGLLSYWLLMMALDQFGWADAGGLAAAATAALIAIASAIFLFRIVAMVVLNIFSDEVVEAVERRHYPGHAQIARPPDFMLGIKMGLASAGRALLWNLILLPVYILLLVTGIGTALAFLLLNGWLVGRDLQDMVVARHLRDGEVVRDATQRMALSKVTRFGLGLLVTVLLLLPVANLLAPLIGAAMATHLVHRGEDAA